MSVPKMLLIWLLSYLIKIDSGFCIIYWIFQLFIFAWLSTILKIFLNKIMTKRIHASFEFMGCFRFKIILDWFANYEFRIKVCTFNNRWCSAVGTWCLITSMIPARLIILFLSINTKFYLLIESYDPIQIFHLFQ